MVGLSDIPCVGVALNKISEATVEAGIRALRYMLCYKTLLNDLNSEIFKVTTEERRVARLIGEAKDDGKIIEDHVVAWQGDVENVKTEADELTRQTTSTTCFNVVRFPNPVSRFRVGRKAAHLATTVTQHTASGEKFLADNIAHNAPPENVPNSDTSYQIFASRQKAYGMLWNALVNKEGNPIIGIYGMAGAGKTRMMEQAWKELKDKKIFDKFARANVGGEQFDVIKLQDQLSGYLKCHLESKDNEVQRASQLKRSLIAEGQKILVILDDVWADIPLNKIGIPFGDGSSNGCKILLTSRKKNVCLRNKCTDPIEIIPLTNNEAWEMFRNTVGTSKIDSLEDPLLAKKVCKECGGLPLLIDAVGRSLKFLAENYWKDALYQLENCEFQEIDGIEPKVYSGLKFSFEMLAKGEKACLLICSFFPEDAEIDIKMLFDMATGSQLLDSGRDIGGLVDILKSSSLLLEGRDVESVKVHDIIRDVARSIARTDPDYAFLSLRCEKSCLPDNAEYRSRRLLRLDLEGENVEFRDDLDCPELHTLWLQSYNHSQQLSSVFFNAFVNLKVLLLEGEFLFDQQLTIDKLGKLRVLILDRCKISQTFLSSVSRNLDTLCIRRCRLPRPLDLPELKNLRKLELVDWGPVEIVEEAISRISRVEELIVTYGFKSRDDDDDAYIYRELSQLGCLRNIVIWLKKLPDRDIFGSPVEFNIQAGKHRNTYRDLKWKKYVLCIGIYVERWVMPLLERAEKLDLRNITGLPINGFSDSNMEIAFAKLKEMTLSECNEMEHVASWEGRNQRPTCFTNLTSLEIYKCNRLKYVFSDSVAKCLLQLQKLYVERCDEIEEIIRVEDSTDHDGQEIICFPNLQTLYLGGLGGLRSLTCFCKKKVTFPNITGVNLNRLNSIDWLEEIGLGSDDYSSSKLRKLRISCETKQLLPSQLKLHLQYLEKLKLENCCWPGQDSLFDGSLTFNTLKKLYVYNCPVSTLFTSSVFRSLHQLETLIVSDCSLLKEIVEEEDARDDGTNENKTPISLPHLHSLTLSNLPNLQNIGISLLVEVKVTECGMITSLFTRSAFTNLQCLKKLDVSDCSLLKEIVEEEDARDDGTIENKTPISLLQLKYVTLSKLPNLQNIGISACYMPALDSVKVTECGMITSLFTRSAFTNLQHLWMLIVSNCSLLKEIVEEEDARDDGTNENKTPISLLHLQYVSLSKLPNLQNIGISACYMPALYSVKVTECGMITSLFTRSAFTNLQHLWMLIVSNCSLLKEIVEEEDARDDGTNENKTPISLLHLQSITLSKLPNLQNIGISACYMPALVQVKVTECGMITSLFTRSAFTNLQHLRELKVSRCDLLEVIVEDEMDDVTSGMSQKMISLPLLTIITLENLPKVRSFSSTTTFTFDIPALGDLSPSNCPEWRYPHPIPALTMLGDNNQEMIDELQGQEEDEE